MRFTEILEARRNPEQNPKFPINKTIMDKLDATTDNIGGTKNLFVSFTSVDKLGINPKSEYDTPIGIYAYPAQYVVQVTSANKNMSELPFAGNQPYVNLFKASGNVINIARIDAGEVTEYYSKLVDVWSRTSGKSVQDAQNDINAVIQSAKSSAKFKSHPGGEFWYVTMECASKLFAPQLKTSAPTAWNKLFRLIGIDGVVDSGIGIIHTAEPTQAVFFSIQSINNVERHNNRGADTDIEARRGAGLERNKISTQLNSMSDANQILTSLKTVGYEHINTIKNAATIEQILTIQPGLISYINNQTPRQQYIVLALDINNIVKIKNIDDNALAKAIEYQKSKLTAQDLIALVGKMQTVGDATQVQMVKIYPHIVKYIKEPTKNAIDLAIQMKPVLAKLFPSHQSNSGNIAANTAPQ